MGIENQHSFLQYDKIVSESEAYETLGIAIIITAARDLKLAYKRLRRAIICRHSTSFIEAEADRIERFFYSKLYHMTTEIDGEKIIHHLRDEAGVKKDSLEWAAVDKPKGETVRAGV